MTAKSMRAAGLEEEEQKFKQACDELYAVARARVASAEHRVDAKLSRESEKSKPKSARSDEFEEFVREKRQKVTQAFDELGAAKRARLASTEHAFKAYKALVLLNVPTKLSSESESESESG